MLSNNELKRKLSSALLAARCTVFFETYHSATGDEGPRGEHRAWNWQEFEQLFATELVYVHPSQGKIYWSGKNSYTHTSTYEYTNIEDLAKLVARRIGASRPSNHRVIGMGTRSADRDEERLLNSYIEELGEFACSYFERETCITPRAAMILLAPIDVKPGSVLPLVLSDDILINLIRYSPYCAFELIKAGLDIITLMRAGIKHRLTDWSRPRSQLFMDLFGIGTTRVPEVKTIVRTGYIDETNLLCAILQFASAGGTAARRLLDKAIRAVEEVVAPDQLSVRIEP